MVVKKKQQEECWKVMKFVVGKQKTNKVFVKKNFMGLSCFFSQGIEFSCHIYCCYNQLNWHFLRNFLEWQQETLLHTCKVIMNLLFLVVKKNIVCFLHFSCWFYVYLKFHNNHVLFHWNQQELWGFLHKKIFENMQYHKKSPIYILTKFFLCLSNLSFPFVYFVFL